MGTNLKQKTRKCSFYSSGKTIFIGNGLNRAFNGGSSWDELVGIDTTDVPYTLRLRLSNKNLDDAIKELEENFCVSDEFAAYIEKLVDSGFHNFLTTNYTYEIEYSLLPKEKRNYNYIADYTYSMVNDRLDNGISITNYIRIKFKGNIINIWHIHGEIRKKSSLVLDHNKYGILMGKIYQSDVKGILKVDKRGYDYSSYNCKSWVDLFLITDIYFVGYGLNYSEIDIWWVLEKRKKYNLKIKNEIYFYSAYSSEFNATKKLLIKNENIRIISCNKATKDVDCFKNYFRNIINHICK